MKEKIKAFLIKNNLMESAKRVRNLFYENPYKKSRKYGTMKEPSFVVIENTSLCNLKCKMCYINFEKFKKKGLVLEEWKNIIDKLPKSVKRISLIGGEPLMMKGAIELLQYIDSKGIIPIMSTNATLITPENVKELAKTRAINHVNISIDGNRELHNKIRGVPTAFDNMVRGVRLVQENGGNIETVTTVIQDDNFDKLTDVVGVMHELGINHLILEFERKYSPSMMKKSKQILGLSSEEMMAKESEIKYKFSPEELSNELAKVEKLARKKGIYLEYFPNDFRKNIKKYMEARARTSKVVCGYLPVLRLDCQGNIINCPVIRQEIGNLVEMNFKEAWDSDKFRDYRKKLLKNNLVPVCDICFQCKPYKNFKSLR